MIDEAPLFQEFETELLIMCQPEPSISVLIKKCLLPSLGGFRENI